MIIGYNHSTLVIEDKKANSIAIKGLSSAVQVYDVVDGKATVDTSNYAVGDYVIQYFNDNQIIKQDDLRIEQNLKFADANYDPRSKAKITLQAIQAVLAGRATSGQYHVKVGQKELSYCSFDQLIKWKNYFASIVAKEDGRPSELRLQRLYYRGI